MYPVLNNVKLLGVHLDCHLDFDHHVSEIVSSSMYHLKNITKIKRYLTKSETERLVHAFISSKLDYANALLYGVKQSTLTKLQAVQNRAARIVLGLSAFASVTDEMLHGLHWLRINERIIFKDLSCRRSFSYAAPRYWNCLDINTRLK